MAAVYMNIYIWQEKKGEIKNPKIFVMRPITPAHFEFLGSPS
jgi:hypothetical protein